MAELLNALARSSVVLVDHHTPLPLGGCSCGDEVSPALRRFREADDFANRARFVPCRLPWEQLCVDPDGIVRQVDYDHPPLGSLFERPLLDLWNGDVAQQVRHAALRSCRRKPSAGEKSR
jgi:hypothetical protein